MTAKKSLLLTIHDDGIIMDDGALNGYDNIDCHDGTCRSSSSSIGTDSGLCPIHPQPPKRSHIHSCRRLITEAKSCFPLSFTLLLVFSSFSAPTIAFRAAKISAVCFLSTFFRADSKYYSLNSQPICFLLQPSSSGMPRVTPVTTAILQAGKSINKIVKVNNQGCSNDRNSLFLSPRPSNVPIELTEEEISSLQRTQRKHGPRAKKNEIQRKKKIRRDSNAQRSQQRGKRAANGKTIVNKQRQKGSDFCSQSKHPSVLTSFTVADSKDIRKEASLSMVTRAVMPPWLAQYEKDDSLLEWSELHADSDTDFHKCDDGNNYNDNDFFIREDNSNDIQRHHQPQQTPDDESFTQMYTSKNSNELAEQKIHRLQKAMSGTFLSKCFTEPDMVSSPANLCNIIAKSASCLSPSDVHDVLDAVRVASYSNSNLMAGCADFLYLMLTLEEEEGTLLLNSGDSNSYNCDNGNVGNVSNFLKGEPCLPPSHSIIMTRDVLVAAAFHYCDCVRARKAGVYEHVRRAIESPLDYSQFGQEEQQDLVWLPPSETKALYESDALVNNQDYAISLNSADIAVTKKRNHRRGKTTIKNYGEESIKIATGAAVLKRAEIMAAVVHSRDDEQVSLLPSAINKNNIAKMASSSSLETASILRSFLLTLSEDWRALVIRSAACLYRLRGIVGEKFTSSEIIPTPLAYSYSSMQIARDAIRIYGPLAQRMGMHRLKAELENAAFRILYRRQYSVASGLYRKGIDEMKTILEVLSSKIQHLLRSDAVFMQNVADVRVYSRIKETYSLWKKILRHRKEAMNLSSNVRESLGSSNFLKWVPDAIAFRVVICGQRLPLEDEESLRTREKMLCYYAFQLVSDVWPPSKANVAKDYIKDPKPNGYQSLHYTAALIIHGEEWPFEVQIRSEEMHQIAEYGVAAHWDYKLQSKMATVFSQELTKTTPLLALPAVRNEGSQAEKRPSNRTITSDPPLTSSSFSAPKGRIASYIEALTISRKTLIQNNIFIFISPSNSALDGKIISLDPSAGTVADVVKQYDIIVDANVNEESLNSSCVLYRNGMKTAMDEQLQNGDVLTLPSYVMRSIEF